MYVGTIMTNEIESLGSENLQQKDQLYTSETKPQVHKHIPELFKTAKIFILKNISIDDRKNELFDYLGNFHIQGWEKIMKEKIDMEVILLSYTGYQNVKGLCKLILFEIDVH